MLRLAIFEFKAVLKDLMNVRANFLNLLGLILIAQSMYAQEQAIVIDVEFLEQSNVILYLLDQCFLYIPLDTYLFIGFLEVKVFKCYAAFDTILRRFLCAPSLLWTFEVIAHMNVPGCFENVSHNHEIYADFSSYWFVILDFMEPKKPCD